MTYLGEELKPLQAPATTEVSTVTDHLSVGLWQIWGL